MIKRLLLTVFFLFLFPFCRADFERIYLGTLINNSTLIVDCRITKVLDDKVQVEILDLLKGEWRFKRLAISKFQNWVCASRLYDYEIGQHQILFLAKSYEGNIFNTMGAGNEGEIPILNDSCFYGGKRFHLIDLKRGIKEYLNNKVKIDNLVMQGKKIPNSNNQFLRQILNEL